jgi:uncharacterized protein YwqG
LRTTESVEGDIAPGASKLGGQPDLPASAKWPVCADGKPLAFLAQIDLAEITAIGSPIEGLPSAGLLSVFSAWGWQTDEGSDPQPRIWSGAECLAE